MRLVRGLVNFPKPNLPAVITIGNYDGIHLGHQQILHAVSGRAKAMQGISMLITFEPQPREYFLGIKKVPRLTNLREKLVACKNFGIDSVLVLPFDKKMADLSAPDFISQILISKLNAKYIIVGEDFCFGQNQSGDFQALQKYAATYKYQAEAVPLLKDEEGIRISSSLIRKALGTAELTKVNKLLGRPYSILGKIVHGDQRGRALLFPTANISLRYKAAPLFGVYAIRAWKLGSQPFEGVANVGIRPTFGGKEPVLEFYLFDFNQDIYGKLVRVEFLHKIRTEQEFSDFDRLKTQIDLDIAKAKQFFVENTI
jgi:riboflavin kinase / FMN adenylyltransferase